MAKSEALGTERVVALAQGPIVYRERGVGPAVVFVHGIVVNADLWRAVVPGIAAAGYRCIAPDWPLGAHTRPMQRGADLSPVSSPTFSPPSTSTTSRSSPTTPVAPSPSWS